MMARAAPAVLAPALFRAVPRSAAVDLRGRSPRLLDGGPRGAHCDSMNDAGKK